MNVIGKATLNWEKYTEYVQRETINVKEHLEDSWYLDIRYKVPHEVESIVWSCMRKIGEFKNGPIAIPKEEIVEEIKKHQQYLTSMNLYWDLMFYNSDAAEIRSGELVVVVPSYVIEKVMEFENVDDIPVNELRNRIGAADSGSHEVTQKYDLSRNQMKNKISATQEKINKKQAELEQLEKEKKEELERFRLELEKKYQSKMDLMNEKQEELKQQMEVLNRQMFLLNTEIYSIRCFMGETVDFIPLTTGAYSKVTDPLVVYQKIRYLDEELGKWISIYDVDGDDTALFEDMLKSRPDLRDMFVPGNKCISLVRAAHNKIRYCESKQIANTLKKYYVYHANKVGILVRDGENLWIGWTDQDRIDIPDGNVFYRPETKEASIEDSKGGQRTSTKEETASRYFIFSILQGLIHNGKLLHLPEGVQISKPNPYIVLSMADGWLEDDRYGTFSSIVERTSAPLQKGDMLLTTLSIKRDDAYSDKKYRAWDNDRGRGSYNRTYDASIPNRSIEPVNLIDREKIYEIIYKKYKLIVTEESSEGEFIDGTDGAKSYTITTHTQRTQEYLGLERNEIHITNDKLDGHSIKGMSPEEVYQLYKKRYYIQDVNEQVVQPVFSNNYDSSYYTVYDHTEYVREIRHNYISAQKSDTNFRGDGKDAYANMEVFSDEYLNLTFLNSVYLLYAIQNRNIGGWVRGGQVVSYADSIPYLNKALEYIREREKDEAELLEQYMDLYDDWQVDLSEWRLAHNYHRLTDTRAQKFAREFKKK